MKKALSVLFFAWLTSCVAISQNIIPLQPGPDEGKDAQLWSYQKELLLLKLTYISIITVTHPIIFLIPVPTWPT